MHGTTVIASFKQEVERSDQHMRDLISHLNGEGGATGATGGADNSTDSGVSSTGEALEKIEVDSTLTGGVVAEESLGNVTSLLTSSVSLEVAVDGKSQSLKNNTVNAPDDRNNSENSLNRADSSTSSVVADVIVQNSTGVTVSEAVGESRKNILTPLPGDGSSESDRKKMSPHLLKFIKI